MIEFARFGSVSATIFARSLWPAPTPMVPRGDALYEGDGAGKVGSPDTHLLILLGRKREWISDAAMPTVGSNLALDTANP